MELDRKELAIKCDTVKTLDEAQPILTQMAEEITYFRTALGLAANQIGIKKCVVMLRKEDGNFVTLINPEITYEKGKQKGTEACLSLPGVEVEIERPLTVKVKAVNQYFNPVKYTFTGRLARIACHEIDHLNGLLILDRVK